MVIGSELWIGLYVLAFVVALVLFVVTLVLKEKRYAIACAIAFVAGFGFVFVGHGAAVGLADSSIVITIVVGIFITAAWIVCSVVQRMRRKERMRPRISFQFTVKTLVVATVAVAFVATVMRLEWYSVVIGLGGLFAILVFAEDIWRWLPR